MLMRTALLALVSAVGAAACGPIDADVDPGVDTEAGALTATRQAADDTTSDTTSAQLATTSTDSSGSLAVATDDDGTSGSNTLAIRDDGDDEPEKIEELASSGDLAAKGCSCEEVGGNRPGLLCDECHLGPLGLTCWCTYWLVHK
jgi:hypothetical protein